ncbi:unnamed protein product [Urochloa humidicola]
MQARFGKEVGGGGVGVQASVGKEAPTSNRCRGPHLGHAWCARVASPANPRCTRFVAEVQGLAPNRAMGDVGARAASILASALVDLGWSGREKE